MEKLSAFPFFFVILQSVCHIMQSRPLFRPMPTLFASYDQTPAPYSHHSLHAGHPRRLERSWRERMGNGEDGNPRFEAGGERTGDRDINLTGLYHRQHRQSYKHQGLHHSRKSDFRGNTLARNFAAPHHGPWGLYSESGRADMQDSPLTLSPLREIKAP